MPDQSNTLDNLLCDVRDIIREIEEKSISGDYIYRGEPEHHEESPYYGKICSSLYRQYARIEADEFDIEIVQEEILAEAEGYSHETDDPIEILTQLQHYGGKTNLIDFTTDHLIALFFACDRSDSLKEDGRLILFKRKRGSKRPDFDSSKSEESRYSTEECICSTSRRFPYPERRRDNYNSGTA